MAYDDTNRGALFKNDDKQSDKHPDYKGKINVGGVDYWLSAWLKEAESGRKYMSLSVQPKEQQQQGKAHGDRPGGPKNKPAFDDGGDCPF